MTLLLPRVERVAWLLRVRCHVVDRRGGCAPIGVDFNLKNFVAQQFRSKNGGSASAPFHRPPVVFGVEEVSDILMAAPGPRLKYRAALSISYVAGLRAAEIRARDYSVFHPCGTCRMGPEPGQAVVDPDLRVHGLDGLRVADASIFPEIPSDSTNAPALMVREMAFRRIVAAAG